MAFAGLLILTFLAVFAATEQTHLWRRHATRVHALSSIVVRDKLYLDGGEIITPGPGYSISGAALQIDLASSWTTSNVKALYGLKPPIYPYARRPSLWSDGAYLYSAGGITFYYPDCTNSCQDPIWRPDKSGGKIIGATSDGFVTPELASKLQPVPIQIWAFPIDEFKFEYNAVGQYWFKAPLPYQLPDSFGNLQGAIGTNSGNKFFALGGFSGIPYGVNSTTNWVKGTPGIASWNVDGTGWKNMSTKHFQPGGFAALGQGIPIPFGDSGSIVYIGGYAPPNANRFNFTSRTVMADMTNINIYDIAAERFLFQKATGTVPDPRWAFCAVAASESNTNTVDIFMFGGFRGWTHNETVLPSLQKVYILSIPSFTWTEATAEDQEMRSYPTCQVIGNRQMIVVGGGNPNDTALGESHDPWTNFIGIFDMTKWKWKFNYDSKAMPYKRNEKLVGSIRGHRFPRKWHSGTVRDLFRYNISTPINHSSPGENALGVKVGVAIAVVVVLLLVLVLVLWRWKKRRSMAAGGKEMAESDDLKKFAEAPNDASRLELGGGTSASELGPEQAHELGPPQPHELNSKAVIYELDGAEMPEMPQEPRDPGGDRWSASTKTL